MPLRLREALCRFRMRQGRVELFERPVYFAAGDHQGWTNTDGVIVGILAQDAATAQRIAVSPTQFNLLEMVTPGAMVLILAHATETDHTICDHAGNRDYAD
jgi:hypothetical protein